eukprot:m.242005 g.242005  ORF g.242005 m.242005 type:complete len:876 (+) comp19005_c0_seq7:143-2770(+)
MLLAIISVLTERMHFSPKPYSTHLRSKIVSMLAIAPSTHSKIMKHLRPPSDACEEGCELHEQLLDELAEYSQSSDGLSERQYKLRGETWREFDPSQVALRTHSHRDLQAAIERYFQEAPASVQGSPPATTNALQACPPFRMPSALPAPLGARLSFVLFSPVLHDLLFRVFRLSIASTASSPSSSRPLLISAALHLLRLCCCAGPDAGSGSAEAAPRSFSPRGAGDVRHRSVLQSAVVVQPTGETLLGCVLALVGKPDVFADQQYLLGIVSLFAKDPACAAAIRASGIEPHAEHAPSQAAVDQKTKRKQKAKARKAALMARLHQQQKAFLAAHEGVAGVARARGGLHSGEAEKKPLPDIADEAAAASGSAVVPASTPATIVPESETSLECAICFHALSDAPAASREQRPVLIGLAQASSVARVEQLFGATDTNSPRFTGSTVFHTCGHWAHSKCISSYTKSLHSTTHPPQFKHRRVLERRDEFLCPICRRLSNCALPLLDRVLSAEMAQTLHSWSSATSQDATSLLGVRGWADSFPTVTVQLLPEVAQHAEPMWCPPLAWTDTAGRKALTQTEGRSPNLFGQVIPDDDDVPLLATLLADGLHDLWEHPAAGSHAQQMLLQLISSTSEAIVSGGSSNALTLSRLMTVAARRSHCRHGVALSLQALAGRKDAHFGGLVLNPVRTLMLCIIWLPHDELLQHLGLLLSSLHTLLLTQVAAAAAAFAVKELWDALPVTVQATATCLVSFEESMSMPKPCWYDWGSFNATYLTGRSHKLERTDTTRLKPMPHPRFAAPLDGARKANFFRCTFLVGSKKEASLCGWSSMLAAVPCVSRWSWRGSGTTEQTTKFTWTSWLNAASVQSCFADQLHGNTVHLSTAA